jgi:hypothetical protein
VVGIGAVVSAVQDCIQWRALACGILGLLTRRRLLLARVSNERKSNFSRGSMFVSELWVWASLLSILAASLKRLKGVSFVAGVAWPPRTGEEESNDGCGEAPHVELPDVM